MIAFNITKNLNYDGLQRILASTVYKCFDKNSANTFGGAIEII